MPPYGHGEFIFDYVKYKYSQNVVSYRHIAPIAYSACATLSPLGGSFFWGCALMPVDVALSSGSCTCAQKLPPKGEIGGQVVPVD